MTPRTLLRCAIFAVVLLIQGHTALASDTVIQRFGTAPDGTAPFTPLVADASGNLYGAAEQGGKYGQGVVYELSPPTATTTTWTHTAIYSFPPSKGIGQPQGALVLGQNGALYGTANVTDIGDGACTAFQLTPPAAGSSAWTETDLYSFRGQTVVNCGGAIIEAAGGALYGTLPHGGTYGQGGVFKLTPSASASTGWTMATIYSFRGCAAATSDSPASLVIGPGGVLYGIASGCGVYGNGAVFQLAPSTNDKSRWVESEIYSFTPELGAFTALSVGANGVLYGTSAYSTSVSELIPPGSGHKAWTLSTLYRFPSGTTPAASILPRVGDSLYGTTTSGGANGFGFSFKLSPPTAGQTQWRETELHSFNGVDGGFVEAGLIKGPAGLLYGVADIGGASGNGTVFSLHSPSTTQPDWIESPVYAFSGAASVAPNATLISDGSGALYGMSGFGTSTYGTIDGGAVFKLVPPATGRSTWKYDQIATFFIGNELGGPQAPLVMGKKGVLYGGYPDAPGGDLFMLTPPAVGATAWTRTDITPIGGLGFTPVTSLVEGPDGTLYAVTGKNTLEAAELFALTPPTESNKNWSSSTIFQFPSSLDVENYFLTIAPDGTLYGTSTVTDSTTSPESGNIFKLTPPAAGQGPSWTQTILYSFTGGADGSMPNGPLVVGPGGVLYGTTLYGGNAPGAINPFDGDGTVFALAPPAAGQIAWTESILYRFAGGRDGALPESTLVRAKDGTLYGITSFGGEAATSSESASGNGTVYKLTPPKSAGSKWTHSVLHRFVAGQDGSVPLGGLVLNADGKLYGTTVAGGGGAVGRFTLGYPFGNQVGFGPNQISLGGTGTAFQITP